MVPVCLRIIQQLLQVKHGTHTPPQILYQRHALLHTCLQRHPQRLESQTYPLHHSPQSHILVIPRLEPVHRLPGILHHLNQNTRQIVPARQANLLKALVGHVKHRGHFFVQHFLLLHMLVAQTAHLACHFLHLLYFNRHLAQLLYQSQTATGAITPEHLLQHIAYLTALRRQILQPAAHLLQRLKQRLLTAHQLRLHILRIDANSLQRLHRPGAHLTQPLVRHLDHLQSLLVEDAAPRLGDYRSQFTRTQSHVFEDGGVLLHAPQHRSRLVRAGLEAVTNHTQGFLGTDAILLRQHIHSLKHFFVLLSPLIGYGLNLAPHTHQFLTVQIQKLTGQPRRLHQALVVLIPPLEASHRTADAQHGQHRRIGQQTRQCSTERLHVRRQALEEATGTTRCQRRQRTPELAVHAHSTQQPLHITAHSRAVRQVLCLNPLQVRLVTLQFCIQKFVLFHLLNVLLTPNGTSIYLPLQIAHFSLNRTSIVLNLFTIDIQDNATLHVLVSFCHDAYFLTIFILSMSRRICFSASSP